MAGLLLNGVFDRNVLVQIPNNEHIQTWDNPESDIRGQWIRRDLLPQLLQGARMFFERTGQKLYIREGFRTIALQTKYWHEKPAGSASFPGLSGHGWGEDLDIWSGIDSSFTSPNHLIWNQICVEIGGDNTGRFFAYKEPWHYKITFIPGFAPITIDPAAGGATIINPLEDPDMPTLIEAQGTLAKWTKGEKFVVWPGHSKIISWDDAKLFYGFKDADIVKLDNAAMGRFLAINGVPEQQVRSYSAITNSLGVLGRLDGLEKVVGGAVRDGKGNILPLTGEVDKIKKAVGK